MKWTGAAICPHCGSMAKHTGSTKATTLVTDGGIEYRRRIRYFKCLSDDCAETFKLNSFSVPSKCRKVHNSTSTTSE